MLKLSVIKKLRAYLRSIKEYRSIKEEINKSFYLSQKKIQNIYCPLSIVKQNDKQVGFSEKLIKRLRNILSNEIVVSGHWTDMYNLGDKESIFQRLLDSNDEEFYEIVSNPQNNNLHFGFGDICEEVINNHRLGDFYINKRIYDTIYRISCSLGIENFPETYHFLKFNFKSADEMLEKIFQNMNIKTDFPNIFKGEFGLKTKYGLVSFAPIQQMYHATRILDLKRNYNIHKVMEIGAGLGLSAYHSRNFGIKDYTILDLSLGNLSQSFFFASTIGEENILINDEVLDKNNNSKDKIKLISSTRLDLVPEKLDLVLNCDSITEMSKDQALKYVNFVSKKTKYFLSINHDNNKFKIEEIFKDSVFKRVYRMPSWYRRGYIEELYINTSF